LAKLYNVSDFFSSVTPLQGLDKHLWAVLQQTLSTNVRCAQWWT